MNKKMMILSALIIFLGGAFLIGSHLYRKGQAENIEKITKKNFEKLVPDHAVRVGAIQPKIYLVEFMDPECESCREMYPFVKKILKDYDGKIQLIIRYAAFHSNSKLAIKILEAARKQGKYWETMDVLMNYQPQWGSHHDPRPDLIWSYLPEAGVDVEKIRTSLDDPAVEKLIESDEKDMRDLEIRQTPTFFINGTQVHLYGYQALNDLIQSELKSFDLATD